MLPLHFSKTSPTYGGAYSKSTFFVYPPNAAVNCNPHPPTSGNSGDMDFQRCHGLKFPNPLEHSSLENAPPCGAYIVT